MSALPFYPPRTRDAVHGYVCVCLCVPFSPRALNMYALHKRQHNLSKALHRICFCFEIYLNELEATEDIANSFHYMRCVYMRYLAFTPEL